MLVLSLEIGDEFNIRTYRHNVKENTAHIMTVAMRVAMRMTAGRWRRAVTVTVVGLLRR